MLIPNEEMEAITNRLLETAERVGGETYQMRTAAQGTHCKIGEQGLCCVFALWVPAVLPRSRPAVFAVATPTVL